MRRWGLIFPIIIVCMIIHAVSYSQQSLARLSGRVTDETDKGLAYVNVYVKNATTGTTTNHDGVFKLMIPKTTVEVVFSLLGYEEKTLVVEAKQEAVRLDVTLREIVLLHKEVLVVGTYESGESKMATLNSLEVVSNPAASGDIFHAVKTFPGLTFVDESAGLYVRGGDLSETSVFVNGALLSQPFQFESPYGNTFGLLDPFLVKGASFSSGGFPVKYGNALSGILSLETRDLSIAPVCIVNLSLASANVVVGMPIKENALGIRASARKTFTDLLFRVNLAPTTFIETPSLYDATLGLIYNDQNGGTLKTFHLYSEDKVTSLYRGPLFSGGASSSGENQYHSALFSKIVSENILIEGSLSYNPFEKKTEVGNLRQRLNDDVLFTRFDVSLFNLFDPLKLSFLFGGDFTYVQTDFYGQFPADRNDLRPDAPTVDVFQTTISRLMGAYLQAEMEVRRLLWIGGVRYYFHHPSRKPAADLRTSVGYALSDNHSLKISVGAYHKYASNAVYSSNPGAPPALSVSLIGGYEYRTDCTDVRIEAYRKWYRNLSTAKDGTDTYTADGSGFAHGVDVFLKGQPASFLSGWVSYSYLDSRRRNNPNASYSPSDFDITHSLLITGQFEPWAFLRLGLTYRSATGRPYTPFDTPPAVFNGSYWEPLYVGELNSARMPNYSRFDVSLTYLYPFTPHTYLVFFATISNVLNSTNIQRYEYSRDYSERREVLYPYGRRFYYFGVSFSHNILQ